MPSALSPRRRMEAPIRPRQAIRLNESAARETASDAAVFSLLAAPVPETIILSACAADRDLAAQLIQLARLGAATVLANHSRRTRTHVAHTPAGSPLTSRESQLLRLISDGHTVKRAAETIGCAPSTAHTHLSNAYRKLDVPDRTQAVLTARARRFI